MGRNLPNQEKPMTNFDPPRTYIVTLKTQATPFVVDSVASARGEPDHIQLLDSEGSTLFSIPVAELVDFRKVKELPNKVRKKNVNLSVAQRQELE
jgi:hypothetical protein